MLLFILLESSLLPFPGLTSHTVFLSCKSFVMLPIPPCLKNDLTLSFVLHSVGFLFSVLLLM